MGNMMTDWSRHFDEPISLPDGSELETLYDAGRYVEALPKAKHERPEWQVATEILLSAAEGKVPITFADIAIRRAVDASQPAPPKGLRRKHRISAAVSPSAIRRMISGRLLFNAEPIFVLAATTAFIAGMG
jgi:hypothetical protein